MDELPADDDLLSSMLLELPVVNKHLRRKTPPQLRVFEKHVLRYLQAYLPDAGFEFAITHRYQTARLRRRITLQGDHASDSNTVASSADYTDMCVLALRAYQPEETILHCSAALKDLTRADDEALRNEAVQARTFDARQGPPVPQRDFSIIRSSSRKLSQLLLGPARFINHDCQPNAEFRRSGHQLTIRCIRPIQQNDEITTYYGDNYFEAANKECMCATCERHQRGYFSLCEDSQEKSSLQQPRTANDSRLLRSAQAAVSEPKPSTTHDMIQSTMDPDASGPVCECQTCHTSFRAPERWWIPDECSRCERHYKLYKADWPNRQPKEDPSMSHSTIRTLKRTSAASQTNRRVKQCVSQSESSTSSNAESPIKMSPVRTINPDLEREQSDERELLVRTNGVHGQQLNGASDIRLDSNLKDRVHDSQLGSPQPVSRSKRRKYEVRSDDSDEEFSRNHRALGPRILGHEASTDLLASFWGAPSGHRRIRRPASMQPQRAQEREASKQKSSNQVGGFSPATDKRERARTAPPKPRSDIVRRPLKSRSITDRHEASSDGKISHSDVSKGMLEQSLSASVSQTETTPAVSATVEQGLIHNADFKQEKLAIATKGPQRTSVSNLALFWSAGVEGRTRRQSRSQTLSTEPAADLHEKMAWQGKTRVNSKKSSRSNFKQVSPTLPGQEISQSDPLITATELVAHPTAGTVKAKSSELEPSSASTYTPPSIELSKQLTASDSDMLPSESSSLSSIIKAESRSNSPLHMPSSNQSMSTHASRQPARRNLRWGSGKTSTSRPILGGSLSTGVSLLSAITGRTSDPSSPFPHSRESSPRFTHETP